MVCLEWSRSVRFPNGHQWALGLRLERCTTFTYESYPSWPYGRLLLSPPGSCIECRSSQTSEGRWFWPDGSSLSCPELLLCLGSVFILMSSALPSFWEKQLGCAIASCVARCEQLPKCSRELIGQTAASDSVRLKVSLGECGGSRSFLWGLLAVQRALRVYAWDCT